MILKDILRYFSQCTKWQLKVECFIGRGCCQFADGQWPRMRRSSKWKSSCLTGVCPPRPLLGPRPWATC